MTDAHHNRRGAGLPDLHPAPRTLRKALFARLSASNPLQALSPHPGPFHRSVRGSWCPGGSESATYLRTVRAAIREPRTAPRGPVLHRPTEAPSCKSREGESGLVAPFRRARFVPLGAVTCHNSLVRAGMEEGPAPQYLAGFRTLAYGLLSASQADSAGSIPVSPSTRTLRHRPQSPASSPAAASAASTCSAVVGNTGTGESSSETRSSISVQPSTTPSAPRATSRSMTSR